MKTKKFLTHNHAYDSLPMAIKSLNDRFGAGLDEGDTIFIREYFDFFFGSENLMDKLNHWSVEQLEYYIDVIIPIFLAELGCQNKKIYRLIKEDKESLEILFDMCNKMVARTLYRNTGITGTVSRLEAAANRDM